VLATSLAASARTAGLYVTDTLALADSLFLNLAARYNEASLTLADRLGTALNGEHRYGRLNPALGTTFHPSPALTLYARHERGMRVPTPVELTCADPNAPCSLPNAFAADPPLAAVIARTSEIGARGALGAHASFTATAFRTQLDNDIQFVSSGGGSVSAGYFRNVGQTRRQGLELGLDGRAGHLSLGMHYTLLEATFRSPLVLNSPDNSTAGGLSCSACREIAVQPGDRLPGIPRQIAKLRAEFGAARYALGVTIIAQSGQYARGDENNRDVNGMLPGFVLVNLDGRLELGGAWSAFVRIDNLFDRAFYSFAALGENVFTAPGERFDPSGASWRAEQFRSVGAPRGAWLGIAYRPAPKERTQPR
jgi:outer membrane receptor protein involved in Fe transport